MSRSYKIAEFARLAGITVRALQYYDRIGLLKPSHVTEAGYRLYQQTDLVRLQQILTLKWMGFALSEIKQVIDSDSYDLRTSLQIQQAAVEAHLARLRETAVALARALERTTQVDADQIDAETIRAIIRGVTTSDNDVWMQRYYSDTAWLAIKTRSLSFSQEELEQGQRAWQDLIAAFARHRTAPPESDVIQQLAAQMHALIEMFTGGNAEIEAGLARFARAAETEALPPEYHEYTPYGNVDADVRGLMQRALTIYRTRNKL